MITLRIGHKLIIILKSNRSSSSPDCQSGLLYLSKQYTSSDGTNRSTKQDTNDSSSSSYYREYNRRKYEQKRTRYDNENRFHEQVVNSQQLNHYQRLNVATDAKVEDIKSAYYNLSKIYHPDVAGDNAKAADQFRLVTESYDVLSDRSQRDEYDRELKLHNSSLETLDPTSWKNSQYPNEQPSPTFQSGFNPQHVIFKSKEDNALELEKLRNPNKFRAGAFDSEEEFTSKKIRQATLGKRLRDFHSNTRKNHDDFYKQHMYMGMNREYEELSSFDFRDHEKKNII